MFIVSKRNVILPSADGSQEYRVGRGFVGEIPDWAASTSYFEALVKDGKIGVTNSRKDSDIADKEKEPVKRRKAAE